MAPLRTRVLLGASLALLGFLTGCLDPKNGAGGTKGTTLIAFDTAEAATHRLLMWDNLDAVVDLTTSPVPTRTLQNDKLNQVKDLAWGGLCVDAPGHFLYAVSASGDVLRVANIHKQSGTIKTPEDIHVFRIEGDRLSEGKFEQAALDTTTRTLYVLETSPSQTRVWAVSGPDVVTASSIAGRKVEVEGSGDKGGTGLAVRNGSLFAFFRDGATIYDPQKNPFEGARLRLSLGGGVFPQSSSVLVGTNTGLGVYGSLAVDDQQRIYLARHLTDSNKTGEPLLVFNRSQFDLSYNQAPGGSFGADTLRNLRVITHAGNKDWLAAADMVGTSPASNLHIWKNVSQRGNPKTMSAGSGTAIKGIALDGSN